MTPRNPADRPATEPHPTGPFCSRCGHEPHDDRHDPRCPEIVAANWGPDGPDPEHCGCVDVDALWTRLVRAEAARGAAPRAEGQRLDWVEITEEHVTESTETATEERETVARWMIAHGYATGHGDTTDDLLNELESQLGAAPRAEGLDVEQIVSFMEEEGVVRWDGPGHRQRFLDAVTPHFVGDDCTEEDAAHFAALERSRPSDERVPEEEPR